jgi:DNA-directed RNA polymerase subunit RPC12/RpoP
MRRTKYICKRCKKVFWVNLLEPGEAEDKKIISGPVQCPECRSMEVQKY